MHKSLKLLALALIILGCAEKSPEYPWITDVSQEVAANGKMVGYEFFAKW